MDIIIEVLSWVLLILVWAYYIFSDKNHEKRVEVLLLVVIIILLGVLNQHINPLCVRDLTGE